MIYTYGEAWNYSLTFYFGFSLLHLALYIYNWVCKIMAGRSVWHFHMTVSCLWLHTHFHCSYSEFLGAELSRLWVAPCCKVPHILIWLQWGQAELEHCVVRPLSITRTKKQSPSACYSELLNRWNGTAEQYGFPSLYISLILKQKQCHIHRTLILCHVFSLVDHELQQQQKYHWPCC